MRLAAIFIILVVLAMGLASACRRPAGSAVEWPEITSENRPWARWWWMGSGLDSAAVTALLPRYREAGLGGLEITPIYGVKGSENQFIPYLSPAWMDLLDHTLKQAARQGLGVDMATGTGWPFGGPWVEAATASRFLAHEIYELSEGERLQQPVTHLQEGFVRAVGERISLKQLKGPLTSNANLQALAIDQVRFEKALPLQALIAYAESGAVIDLTSKVDSKGVLNWTAPAGNWTLYALFQGWHGKMVERAAPGGEGPVIDHFSDAAIKDYLQAFDSAFAGHDISGLRAFFNDSYEVDDARGEANWTPQLLEEFEKRRGYDLRRELPALLGKAAPEKNSRVLCDYRQTISELLLETFTARWDAWSERNGAIIRNQAHGSPANILDLYAASDIPETEGNDIMRFKFASSAGNVTGKRLVSAEAATWLNEHFTSSLADVRNAVDLFFLGGVNHIFYHGLNYSPPEEPWPGWLFYAAVHFSPSNPFWNDFTALNHYVARCQSFLQKGRADNDILLYFPAFDRFSTPSGSMLVHFDGMEGWEGSSFEELSRELQRQGYAFDLVSDRQLRGLRTGQLRLAGEEPGAAAKSPYQVIMLPQTQYMPLETFEQLLELARKGATIVAHRQLPQDVPGLGELGERRKKYRELLASLTFQPAASDEIMEASTGKGRIITGNEMDELLRYASVRRESMADSGLHFVRRRDGNHAYYFIRNGTTGRVDGWIPLQADGASAALYYPMDRRYGLAGFRRKEDRMAEAFLQLAPGESCILQVSEKKLKGPEIHYYRPAGNVLPLDGTWELEFVSGGPQMPPAAEMTGLVPWTQLGDEAADSFSGTASYATTFSRPEGKHPAWILDLGAVYHSARVSLNGITLDTLIGPGYRLLADSSLFEANNRLEVSVSNLMGNRIAWMDRQGIPWKKFYNINFPSRLAENRGDDGLFNAAGSEPQPSGLAGPVTLQPVKFLELPRGDGAPR